jgi:endonuclease/exonuclease/phosphatase (EEP) superfamily protein YafD
MNRLLALALTFGCVAAEEQEEGQFSLLTYNVAGLPEGISGSNPSVNTALISPALNAYDLVVVQEDFAYHEELASSAAHPFQSESKQPWERAVSDGLNRFSMWPFEPLQRQQWEQCNGYLEGASDCLAEKGFSVGVTSLSDEVAIHVYNLHAEAGGGPEDILARESNYVQLAAYIEEYSADQPVIVAGDTNLHGWDEVDAAVLQTFMERVGLVDACEALQCGEYHIDRVLVRSSSSLVVQPRTWGVAEGFTDSGGEDLSDHPAIAVTLDWAVSDQ